MSTMQSLIESFLINLEDLSSSQYKNFFKSYHYVKPDENSAPVIDKELIFERVRSFYTSHDYGDAVSHISLENLFEHYQPTPAQCDILIGKVMDIIAGDYGINKDGTYLIKPITIGYTDDNKIRVEAGRHRLAAGINLLYHAGLEDRIGEIFVPVFQIRADDLMVLADNKSRGATQYETKLYRTSSSGVDVENQESMVLSYVQGEFPGTADAQRSALITLLFLKDEGLVDGQYPTTANTKAMVASAVLGMFKNNHKEHAKLMLATNKNLNVQLIADFVTFAVDNYANAVQFAVEQGGVSNISREYKTVASRLSLLLEQAIKDGKFVLPPLPVKESKVKAVPSAEAESEVKEKKERKPRAKKNKTEVPPATVEPETDDVKVIVSQ